MEPEVFFGCQRRKSLQIVDRSGVDCSGGANHAGRFKPRRTILRDRCPQGGKVDAQFGVRRNAPQGTVSQPQCFHGLAVTAVNLI